MRNVTSRKTQVRNLAGLAAIAMTGPSLMAVAHAAIEVRLNEQPLATSVAPVMRNGNTLVPMRDIFEALGATLNWDPATQVVTAQKDQTAVKLAINDTYATVNGQRVLLNQPAILYAGRTMVPLRFVSEAMGAQVYWNPALQRVSVTTPNADDNGTSTAALGSNGTGIGTGLGNGVAVAGARTLSVPTGAVVPVRLDRSLSSATAQVGQTFTASIISERLGDSEFPPGSKVEGVVTEARPRERNNPGVLDFDFRSIIMPDGTARPLHGELIALDNSNVLSTQGHLIARTSSQTRNDKLKVIGVGAGAGYVLGRVLHTDTTISTVLGAAGGYLFGRSRDQKTKEAVLPQGTKIGVRVNDPVTYADATGYSATRSGYLRTDLNTGNLDPSLTADTPAYIATRQVDNGALDGVDNGPGPDFYPARNGDFLPPPANLRLIRIPSGVVVPVRLDNALSSATTQVGQRFTSTIVSQQLGDSEFPPGSRIEGVITEARPHEGDNPGVLDMDFQNVLLPNGTRLPINGELIALDKNNVSMRQGRVVAKTSSQTRGDKLKLVGIGAGVGYVLGRVLHTNKTLTTAAGGIGGYLFGRSRDNKPRDAALNPGTRLGVRLNNGLNYNDGGGYADRRVAYLRGTNAPDANYDNTDFNNPDYENRNGATPHYYDTQQGQPYGAQQPYETQQAQPYGAQPYVARRARAINVPEGVVVPVTLDQSLSSATAQVGQTFTGTITSQQAGDSEFPLGTRIEGEVSEVQPQQGDNPGMLDFNFHLLILPDGTRQPLQGQLINLEDKNITNSQGHLVATRRPAERNDKVKVIGIGAGIGFVAGRLLKKNSTVTALLGALGGYLYGQSKNNNKPAEAVLPQGTRLGVRLNSPVAYADAGGYADQRGAYLRQ